MSVHIDLINLERDADRKAHMQAAFEAVGVDLGVIHPAFDYRVEGEGVMVRLSTKEKSASKQTPAHVIEECARDHTPPPVVARGAGVVPGTARC